MEGEDLEIRSGLRGKNESSRKNLVLGERDGQASGKGLDWGPGALLSSFSTLFSPILLPWASPILLKALWDLPNIEEFQTDLTKKQKETISIICSISLTTQILGIKTVRCAGNVLNNKTVFEGIYFCFQLKT